MTSRPWLRRSTAGRARRLAGERLPRPLMRRYDRHRPVLRRPVEPGMFSAVSATVARVLPPDRPRWIAFGHYESDECGSMNEWLAVAPQAMVAHGRTACRVSLDDMADRAPRGLAD